MREICITTDAVQFVQFDVLQRYRCIRSFWYEIGGRSGEVDGVPGYGKYRENGGLKIHSSARHPL